MVGKQLGFVLIALIALGIVGLVARLVSAETEAPILSNVRPLHEEVIDKVVMRDADNEVIVEKKGGGWWVGSYPAVKYRLADMWDTAQAFDGAELIATSPENHAVMGVDEENTTVVQFWRGDELIEEFFVGDKQYAPIGENPITPWTAYVRLCYLRYPDQDDVYGIFCEWPERFLPNPKFWKDPIITEIPLDEVQSLAFSYPDEQVELQVVNSVWVMTSDGVEREASPEVVLDVLKRVEFLVTDDFPTEDEASRLDFAIADTSLRIGTRQGASADSALLLFLVEEEGDEEVGPSYYVKTATEPYVYILDPDSASKLLKTAEDFIPEPTPTPTPAATPTATPLPTPEPTPTPPLWWMTPTATPAP